LLRRLFYRKWYGEEIYKLNKTDFTKTDFKNIILEIKNGIGQNY
jgi:hypothetical protein